MTVSSTNTKNSYSGNGSTTAFAYTFKVFDEDDLTVILRTDATGTETVQAITTNYTVSGVGAAGGGNVTFVTAPASGVTVVIRRDAELTQTTDYTPNDPFPASEHENALDKLTFFAQQQQEELDRSIKLSRTNTMTSTEFTVGSSDRANKILGFDGTGELSVTQELGVFRGNWSSGTAFAVRDLIKDTTNNNIYICQVAHTSSGSLPISTNTDSSKWELIVDAATATSSATAAAASAAAAATSETNAAASATAAAASEAGVAADAAAAETAKLAAQAAQTAAETAETNAETAETNAETAETNAAASQVAAASSASSASSSASTATTKASEASTSATNAATSASSASSSATAASTSASNAAASETNAATSATSAASSASSASTSATNAATSETNASTSETNAASSATSAASSATSAASSASAASTSETNAATSASNASTSETNAATSETNAATSATNAANSATSAASSASSASSAQTAAETAQTAAEAAKTAAELAADNFDDTYLGAKSSDPTVDNDGDALTAGDLYFNTTSDQLKYYTGSAWAAIAPGIANVSEDTTPQLGGALDVNGNSITSASNGDITIDPNGTGDIVLDANVGIGTATPAFSRTGGGLRIDNGNAPVIRLDNGSSNVSEIYQSGVNTVIDSRSPSGVIKLSVQDSEKMRLTSAGLLLVNTTTEGIADYGDTLTIADTGHAGMTIRSGTSSEGNVYFSDGTSGDAEYKGIVKYDHSSNAMSFWSNSLRRMTITSDGKIGIGTASPTASKLQVDGTDGTIARFRTTSGSNNTVINITSNDSAGTAGLSVGGNSSFPAMTFENGGSERMRITSGGITTVGGTSGIARLNAVAQNWPENALGIYSANISGQTNFAGIAFFNQDTDATVGNVADIYTNPTGTLSLTSAANPAIQLKYGSQGISGGTPALTVDSSGRIGIGTSSPQKNLQITSSTATLRLEESGGSSKRLDFEIDNSAVAKIMANQSGSQIAFHTVGSERARFDSSGNFMVGKTSGNIATAGIELRANDDVLITKDGNTSLYLNRLSSNGTTIEFHRSSSNIGNVSVSTVGVTYNTTSDIRLKQDIEPLQATDKLMAMNPVSYAWKADPDGPRSMGFIAQEMQEVMPEAVSTGDDDDAMMSMDYGRITPILVSALQDAHRKIEQLESRIAAMETGNE
jgi:hypothetical protein